VLGLWKLMLLARYAVGEGTVGTDVWQGFVTKTTRVVTGHPLTHPGTSDTGWC